jgi:hypothetical protein
MKIIYKIKDREKINNYIILIKKFVFKEVLRVEKLLTYERSNLFTMERLNKLMYYQHTNGSYNIIFVGAHHQLFALLANIIF